MHKLTTLATVLAAALILGGCGAKKPVLNIYNWSDYMDPDILAAFEQEHNCRVVIDTFDSNETMYAKIKNGKSRYDLLFPSSYQIELLKKQGLIRTLDRSKLPNVEAHYCRDYLNTVLNKTMDVNVPYAITLTGIAYRKDKLEKPPVSWSDIENPAIKGRSCLLNDPRETIGAALKHLGFSLNSKNPEELEQAADVVIRWKRNIAKFDNEQYKTGIANGEFLFAMGYNCDISQIMIDDPENIGFVYPAEGFSAACDEMVIPTNAGEVDLAHAFINYLYDPEVAARNIAYICSVMPNTAALAMLSDELRGNPAIIPPAEVMDKAEILADVGEAIALYSKAWDRIKAAE